MAGEITRRSILFAAAAAAKVEHARRPAPAAAEWRRFADRTTDIEVFRLTSPEHPSAMPPPGNRAWTRDSATLLFSSDQGDGWQAFQMNLKSGETQQLTAAAGLDPRSLCLLPGDREFCYFAGRSLFVDALAAPRQRAVCAVPEGWQPDGGVCISADGAQAVFVERAGEASRLRQAPLSRGPARTLLETPFAISDPQIRPRGGVLYRQGEEALWLLPPGARQPRRLPTPPGRILRALWNPDGGSVLYLQAPAEARQLNAIREFFVESAADRLVAQTSQFSNFGFNRNTSVFVGASGNAASPCILLLLRVTRREFTLCEHGARQPGSAAPAFSPDAQNVFFQSDRAGASAIYRVRVEALVERIREEGG